MGSVRLRWDADEALCGRRWHPNTGVTTVGVPWRRRVGGRRSVPRGDWEGGEVICRGPWEPTIIGPHITRNSRARQTWGRPKAKVRTVCSHNLILLSRKVWI